MTNITTRAAVGRPLTYAEMDSNFNNLNTSKAEQGTVDALSQKVTQVGNAANAAMQATNQLESASGASLVGYGADFVASALDSLRVPDYATLRTYTGPQKTVIITGYLVSVSPAGIGGLFVLDSTDTTSADNGGTIIVSSNGKRWKRILSGNLRPEWFGAKADGATDDTQAFLNLIAALPVGGAGELVGGASYRITNTLTLASRHLICSGKATLIADLNSSSKDAVILDAVDVRIGSAQDYVPGARLEGVVVLVRSLLRDGLRIAYGDFPTLYRVDVQRDPSTGPVWRDGIHLESKGNGFFIENIDFQSVRVHDAGRDCYRLEVPSSGTNVFINVGTYINCEARGSGLCQSGVPVRFVSNNTTATEKISSHSFIGGEFQTNSTATNPNPDGFHADKVAGGASIENIHIEGATAECVPTTGTGLAVNTTNMTRVTLMNFLPFGFTGAPTAVGGTGDYITLGYLGLDSFTAKGTWTIGLVGTTTAGTPTVAYQKGVYSRCGKQITASGQTQISSWGGAAGPIQITGLPFPVANDPFAQPTGVPWDLNSINLGTGYTMPVVRGNYGTSTMTLWKIGSGVNAAAINVADAVAGAFEIGFSITYFTD